MFQNGWVKTLLGIPRILVGLLIILLLGSFIRNAESHGRFIKPPNRSSIWRIPEFKDKNPPVNYNDNELFCGSVHQKDNPGLDCGVCGDPLTETLPRDNEIGGKFYKGIITGEYSASQVINVEVELTRSHKGFMEWRLCTNPSTENQACFNRYLLARADGQGTKVDVDETGLYKAKLKLPAGITCSHCIIQWNYRAGNDWGQCENGKSALGCGPQETFRGCSDISIS